VIDTKTFGTAPDRDQLVEHTDDPLGGQGYINLYPQRFAVVIVDDVEGPEGAPVMVLVIEYEPHWITRDRRIMNSPRSLPATSGQHSRLLSDF
jgi:hypothetical protein